MPATEPVVDASSKPDCPERAISASLDTLFWNVLRHDLKLEPAATDAMLLSLLRKIFAAALPDPP